MTMDQKKHTDFERRDFLKQLDIYLEKDIKDLFQYESILIKSSLEKLWRVVSNWVEFRKLVPFIADEVIYSGDPLVKGTNIVLKWFKKNAECIMNVIEANMDDQKNFGTYSIMCVGGNPKPPLQHVFFIFTKINEETVFLEFKHSFLEPVKYEVLNSISQDKKKILSELRKKIELII